MRFGKFFRKNSTTLTGAPAVRRQKTYSAQSGYVYQYHYQGQRAFESDFEQGTEYVFEVSADRTTSSGVSVFVSQEAVGIWEQAHGRTLISAEHYAIAKMALFRAFDRIEHPSTLREGVPVCAEDVDTILENLGID